MPLNDPAGTLGKTFYLGQTPLAAGDVMVTILIPGGARDTYVFHALPNWNTDVIEIAHGNTSVEVAFINPAPAVAMDGDPPLLRWGVWIA